MALTGIQIFKFLPGAKKTENSNCKKCGCATCMAYAMKLAKGDVGIDKCPYIDEELKKNFAQENRKPQVKIEFGPDGSKVVIGDENVMFRHDKTFVNQTLLSVSLNSEDIDFDAKINQIISYKISRVGNDYGVDAVALVNTGKTFIDKAKKMLSLPIAVILITDELKDVDALRDSISINKPLIYLRKQNIEELANISKFTSVVVDGSSIDEIISKTDKLTKLGCNNIVINLLQKVSASIIEPLTMIRRSAIEDKFELLGFPVMVSYSLTGKIALDSINLSSLVCKYANLILTNKFNPALFTTLITLRMNIYTDPQKPLQVEPKLYEIGDVTSDSPVVVTTNFALTYFAVVNELESLSHGVYLIITNSDGMSVLTAWSASKLTGEIIAKAVKAADIKNKINHNNIIIPGLVADLKEEIEEELPDFNIIVGTAEATDLPEFLKKL